MTLVTRLRTLPFLLWILAIASVSAQTVTPQDSLVPRQGDWLLSAGPAFASDTMGSHDFPMNSTKSGYGGYVALDYFATRPFSLRSEVDVFTASVETNVIGTIQRQGEPARSVVLNLPARTTIHLAVGCRLYPLQLTKSTEFRLQPFFEIQAGGMFFIPSNSITGPASIDPCLLMSVGGGADLALNRQWSASVQAKLYTSVSDTDLHEDGVQIPLNDHGLLATAGVRYRF